MTMIVNPYAFGAGTPSTSYANSGGTGNRTASIAITTSATVTGTLNSILDGTTGSGGFTFTNTQRGFYVEFDFGAGAEKCIDEIKLYWSSTSASMGQWVLEGGDIATATGTGFWDVLTTFTPGSAATETFSFSNVKRYRYYRLRKDLTNTMTTTVSWREIEFKIDSVGAIATPVSTNNHYGQRGGSFSRSSTSIIVITTTATVSSGAIANFIDGVAPGVAASTSNAFKFTAAETGKIIKFDFGASYSPKITELTIFEALNEGEGTWIFEGSNDDSSYTSLSSTFTWNGSAGGGQVISFVNTTAYRYYRLRSTAGNTSSSAFQNEIYFSLSA